MFNMGMGGDFSSTVSKDLAGKRYHSELATEVEKFLCSGVLAKLGGVVALIDLYCMYNRARGTDLVSPDDIHRACRILTSIHGGKILMKTFPSGVKVVQLKEFNQDSYF
jgi:ESCRT-II complex subunit VPS36